MATGSSKKKTEILSAPFKTALQAYLRHKYPTKEKQQALAAKVDRPFSTISGFIYNGIGGHELQYALFAASQRLTTKAQVEQFIEKKQVALFSASQKDLSPSMKLFLKLYNNTDEELLYYFMQTVSMNIKLANDLGITLDSKKKSKQRN